jgi:hypothetical protein
VTKAALTLGLAVLTWCAAAQAESVADTVEITSGPLSGQALSDVVILNQACKLGDHYHFEITGEGLLETKGPLSCGSLANISGGELVCHLTNNLQCQSRAGDGVVYTVDEKGVTDGTGTAYPWADPQQAAVLFPLIKFRVAQKCDSVLAIQSNEKAHNKQPSDAMAAEEVTCKPTLDKLCAAESSGPVKLASGKDVTNLCR